MRLSRPVYETVPLLYLAIGAFAFLLAFFDPTSRRATIAFVIGMLALIAALTVFLRRQDYRAQSRVYSGDRLDLHRR
jgi:hypothetical protein